MFRNIPRFVQVVDDQALQTDASLSALLEEGHFFPEFFSFG